MRPVPRNPETCASFFEEGVPAGVLTTQPLGRTLDYLAPAGGCALGAFVEVPLGPRRVLGVVWGAADGTFPREKLRSMARVLDAAPMREEMREFLMRAADYTLTPCRRCCGWGRGRRGWAIRRRCGRSTGWGTARPTG
jgi:hypothetical protein